MINRDKIPKYLIFLVTGGTNTLLCLALYWFLIREGMHYLLASTIMFAYGVVQGYLFSSFFVFQHSVKFKNLVKYAIVYMSSYVFNIVILYLCVNDLRTSEFMGQVITSFLVATLNYLLVKRIVFKAEYQ